MLARRFLPSAAEPPFLGPLALGAGLSYPPPVSSQRSNALKTIANGAYLVFRNELVNFGEFRFAVAVHLLAGLYKRQHLLVNR